jgi:HTH-type transcriptional regulator / antitoxin HigA
MRTLEYRPTQVSPPGETLQDLLEERGIVQADLAARLSRSTKNLSQVMNGKAPISPELALDLERVLGVPAKFWLNRESAYREWLSRTNLPGPTEEDLAWVRSFPYSKMAALGWVPASTAPKERHALLLRFFGVVSRSAFIQCWNVNIAAQYRWSVGAAGKDHLIAAWLRQGENEAESIETAQYSDAVFENVVNAARGLTQLPPEEFSQKFRTAFAKAGVILLFVPELPGMGVSGATRWLTPDRALIQITLRYKTNDHLWFTIFHEACHILKHPKKAVFLETTGQKSQHEMEADQFAANHLVPPARYRAFAARSEFTKASIEAFAESVGIAPGIVVGRLQHDRLLRFDSVLNSLKVSYRWTDDDD